ncbi:MAG TPA: ATP synthase subunit I [Rhodoferax sp.]|jgi:ATP synthase protein I|nr:ATP synthase subunit I [Rhodoferax sp.]HQY76344.1 ATP synthase subunit I [Rhodoferax sp.]
MTTMPPEADEDGEVSDFMPLTAEQAQVLREQNPSTSPWWVVLGQVLVGVLVTLVAWGISGKTSVAWSAAFGALAVVIPAALFARGVTGQFASANAGAAVMGFFLWEFVKIVLTVSILFVAHRLVMNLNWPVMLVSLVVTMKVYWLALIRHPKRKH